MFWLGNLLSWQVSMRLLEVKNHTLLERLPPVLPVWFSQMVP
jgi:hypothetical protein